MDWSNLLVSFLFNFLIYFSLKVRYLPSRELFFKIFTGELNNNNNKRINRVNNLVCKTMTGIFAASAVEGEREPRDVIR